MLVGGSQVCCGRSECGPGVAGGEEGGKHAWGRLHDPAAPCAIVLAVWPATLQGPPITAGRAPPGTAAPLQGDPPPAAPALAPRRLPASCCSQPPGSPCLCRAITLCQAGCSIQGAPRAPGPTLDRHFAAPSNNVPHLPHPREPVWQSVQLPHTPHRAMCSSMPAHPACTPALDHRCRPTVHPQAAPGAHLPNAPTPPVRCATGTYPALTPTCTLRIVSTWPSAHSSRTSATTTTRSPVAMSPRALSSCGRWAVDEEGWKFGGV